MVVAQIIDSLDAGGAEAVAVNVANALSQLDDMISILVVARGEGALSAQVNSRVKLVYLHKKSVIDLRAFYKLYKTLKLYRVNMVHAHSTSFYWPVFLKPLLKFKLLWHDHFGGSILPNGRRTYSYKPWSKWFDAVLCVSTPLLQNNRQWLHTPKHSIVHLPNFVKKKSPTSTLPVHLPGGYMICVANFRSQKDHLNLLQALVLLQVQQVATPLVLLGQVSDDAYYKKLLDFISLHQLESRVSIITNCTNPSTYLAGAVLGVLSSQTEGMPLALLEYGDFGLPVVATRVGQIGQVMKDEDGWLVPPHQPQKLAFAIHEALTNKDLAKKKATNFQQIVKTRYSEQAVVTELRAIYESLHLK